MGVLRYLVPHRIRAPFGRYSHAVEVVNPQRWLFCSGQLGIAADGAIPDDVEGQAMLCFDAVAACLAEAGMSFADVVRINAYVTERADMAPYMAVRDRYVKAPPPASTLMIVSGFTRPEFKVEIEVVAAQAGGQ
jgi:enamine deaminase RidA (YjgF/YER057c/UK114 family)